jgi:hypothetical protein
MSAIHAKDATAAASAIRSAFEILEMEPHDEVGHDEESEDMSSDMGE